MAVLTAFQYDTLSLIFPNAAGCHACESGPDEESPGRAVKPLFANDGVPPVLVSTSKSAVKNCALETLKYGIRIVS